MENAVPFYTNWTFWAVVIATLALILSQLPPLSLLFRKKKIEVEAHSLLTISHKVGNPNIRWTLNFRNVGGVTTRVKKISCNLIRNNELVSTLNAHNYYNPSDDKQIIFSGFTLRPDEEINYDFLFFKMFDRFENRRYKELEAALQADLSSKRAALPDEVNEAVEADPELVRPFIEMFNNNFVLEPGEYQLQLMVDTIPSAASYLSTFRLTIYESDSNELRRYTESFKYGSGIFFNLPNEVGVFINVEEG